MMHKVLAGFAIAAVLQPALSLPVTIETNMVSDSRIYTLFKEFATIFEKEYQTLSEQFYRYKIFSDNLNFIEQHNAEHPTMKLEINDFADMTHEEFKQKYLGLKMKPSNGMLGENGNPFYRLHTTEFTAETLPESVNWVEQGAVTAPKDQGQCGSCYTFSTTGAVEGAVYRATGQLVSLSEQELVDCSWSYGNQGCNGGLMDSGFQYIIEHGISLENDYSYNAADGQCLESNAPRSVAKISGFRDIPSGDEIALADALTKQPVSIAIDASRRSFMFYQSGVYVDHDCSAMELDHGVLAVGYGTENGQDYYLVKNSWGSSWGDNGYLKMARNVNNQCGVATAASYPVV